MYLVHTRRARCPIHAHQPFTPEHPCSPTVNPCTSILELSTWMGYSHFCCHEYMRHSLCGHILVPVTRLHKHMCMHVWALVCRYASVACVFVLLLDVCTLIREARVCSGEGERRSAQAALRYAWGCLLPFFWPRAPASAAGQGIVGCLPSLFNAATDT